MSDLPPLVFIHGWKASILVDKNSGSAEFAYAFSHILFGIGGDVIDLPMERDASGKQLEDNLVASEPFRYVSCACGTVKLASLYGPLLEHLEKSRGRDVRPFAYDWRRDLTETEAKFETFLEGVKADTGKEPQVVGHSMGCLITLHLLNRRPELFHSVLFGAGAMAPNISLLEDLSVIGGMNTIMNNKQIFNPGQHLSNPGPIHMLQAYPGERARYGSDHTTLLYDALGKPVEFDLTSLEGWRKRQMGIYHPNSGVDVTPAKEEWLRSCLDNCLKFRRGLIPTKSESAYPPVAVLNSDGLPSKFALHLDTNGKLDLGKEAQMRLGDGRVVAEDSVPPKGIPVVKKITNKEEHSVVLNDLAAVDELLDALFAAKKLSRVFRTSA